MERSHLPRSWRNRERKYLDGSGENEKGKKKFERKKKRYKLPMSGGDGSYRRA